MIYVFSERMEAEDVRFIGSFKTKELAMRAVDEIDKKRKWPEGSEAVLIDVPYDDMEEVKVFLYDDSLKLMPGERRWDINKIDWTFTYKVLEDKKPLTQTFTVKVTVRSIFNISGRDMEQMIELGLKPNLTVYSRHDLDSDISIPEIKQVLVIERSSDD